MAVEARVGRCRWEVPFGISPEQALVAVRRPGQPSLLLDGRSEPGEGWTTRVAVVTRPPRVFGGETDGGRAIGWLDRAVRERRSRGGGRGGGIAALLAYELFEPPEGRLGPRLVAFEVEASLVFEEDGTTTLETSDPLDRRGAASLFRRLEARGPAPRPAPGRPISRPRTSLSRDRYLRAVERIRSWIRAGDIYQANLTQTFEVGWEGDGLEVYEALAAEAGAPRAAFVEAGGLAVVSASPETFLLARPDGSVETRPIKGTRRRGRTAAEDRALASDLLGSEKDRAELLMIVDLERNDLGRICQVGSVGVEKLWALRRYRAIHHLVSTVRGRLRREVGAGQMIEAVFPGGSVTGAPKLRAMEILRQLEPVARGFYTGALFWFGDDGTTESSLLIRTLVLEGRRARFGAGGGVVWDSEPEAEWQESNEKARPLARVLGFEPEEAR